MTIYLWKFAKRGKSTKIPLDTDATTVTTAKLFNNVDVINPVVEISTSSYSDAFNYLKMNLLGKDRYYVITNVVQENDHEVLLYLHEDYMATYRDSIRTNSIGWYVERSSIFNLYSGDSQVIYDEGRITTDKSRELLETLKVMSSWYEPYADDGVFIVGFRCGCDLDWFATPDGGSHTVNIGAWGEDSDGVAYGPIPTTIGVKGTTYYVMITHSDMVGFANAVTMQCINCKKGSAIQSNDAWSNFTGAIESIRYVPLHYSIEGNEYSIGNWKFYHTKINLYLISRSLFPNCTAEIMTLSPVNYPTGSTMTDAQIQTYTDGIYTSIVDETIKIPVRDDALISNSGTTKVLEYMNETPFTKYFLWIPFVGALDFNSNLISKATYDNVTQKWVYKIDLLIDADLISGVIKVELRDTNTNTTIRRESCSIGTDIGSVKFDSDGYKGVTNAILGIGSAFVGLGLAGAVGGVGATIGTGALRSAQNVIKSTEGVKQYDILSGNMVNPYQDERDIAQDTINAFNNIQNKNRINRVSSIVGATLGGVGSIATNLGGSSFTSGALPQGTFIDGIYDGNIYIYRDILNVLPEDISHVGRPIMKPLLFNTLGYADGQYIKCRNATVLFYCNDSEAKAIEDIMNSGFYWE